MSGAAGRRGSASALEVVEYGKMSDRELADLYFSSADPGAGQELERRLDSLEEAAGEAERRLERRLDALKDGTPETNRLIETVKQVLTRYLFISAYAAVNRTAPDWPDLAVEMLSEEDVWPEDSDPDVLAAFEALKLLEAGYRAARERS